MTYPLEPLLTAVGSASRGQAVALLARFAGVTERTVWRWRHQPLDEDRADRWAIRAGLHPAEVWPDWA